MGRAIRGEKGFAATLVFGIAGGIMGALLSVGTGLLHTVCKNYLRICEPTTSETVWNVGYPLMFVPVYWLVMLALWLDSSAKLARRSLSHSSGDVSPEDLASVDKSLLGTCPNCGHTIRRSAEVCPRCKALVGPNSTWTIKTLNS
jgi:hypothetical protein